MQKLDGGISYVMREVLANLFFDKDRFHVRRSGIQIPLGEHNESVHVLLDMHIHTNDGLADKEFWTTTRPS